MTAPKIFALLQQAGVISTVLKQPEIALLPDLLREEEEIHGAISALEEMKGFTWLVVCTSKRLVFVSKSMKYGYREKEIWLSAVRSFYIKEGPLLNDIHITHGNLCTKLCGVMKSAVPSFSKALEQALKFKINNFRTGNNFFITEPIEA